VSGIAASLNRRPQSVTIAANLLWASLPVGGLRAAMLFTNPAINPAPIDPTTIPGGELTYMLYTLSSFGIVAFLIWKISVRRNWARITLLIIVILGAFPWLLSLSRGFAKAPIYNAASLVQAGLQFCAMVLLFIKPGSHWFRKPAVQLDPRNRTGG
jgi:hypothetical protein